MRTARTLTVSRSMFCAGGCTWSGGVYLVLGGAPGPGGCTWWGVYLVRGGLGGCTWSRGDSLGPGVHLVPGGHLARGCTWSGGVYLVQGGCTWSRGCTWSGGVPGPGGVLTNSPPVDRRTPVNILPCPKLCLRAVKSDIASR